MKPFYVNVQSEGGKKCEEEEKRIRPIEYDKSPDVGEAELSPQKNIFFNAQHPESFKQLEHNEAQNQKNLVERQKNEPEIKESQEKKEVRASMDIQRIQPMLHVSEEADKLARYISEEIVKCPDLAPFIAQGIENFRKSGGRIEGVIPKETARKKKNSLNFSLALERRIHNVYDMENGEEIKLAYFVKVNVFMEKGGIKEYCARIESDKIKDPNWLKKATNCMATDPIATGKKAEFQSIVQKCIEEENVENEIIYPNAGWRDVPGIGWRYIFGEDAIGEQSGLIHTLKKQYGLAFDQDRLGTQEIFQDAMGMMDICQTRVASTELFLFVHTTMLATLFERLGYRISFLFGISGVTNSRKTSMTLAIAKIFGRGEPNGFRADAQFAIATRGGIETTLGTYKDAPVIIDDFKPGANRQEQKEMDRKLDELARFYGDGIAKKRMTDFLPDKEKKYFPVYGGCVLTMEIVTGVLSSVTRMFITEINVNEVDNKKLKFYQENMKILPTHVYDFLSWVTGRFDEIVLCITDKFKEFREEYKFEVARYSEMYSTLKVTALLLSEYAVERGFWDGEDQKRFILYIEEMVSQELFSMGKRLKSYDKGTLLLKVIEDMMRNVRLTIYSLTPENCANGESCYEDERFFYIQAKILMQAAQNFCMKFSERDQIVNENELISLLEKLEILDIHEINGKRERSRKLPTPRGNTRRYLYIKKAKLNELLDKLE